MKYFQYLTIGLPFLFAMVIDNENIQGTYTIKNTEWGSKKILLKSNGHFIKTIGGCVYDSKITGKWETHNDTLILTGMRKEDLRSNRVMQITGEQDKYIIKTDTLFQLDCEKAEIILDTGQALIRNKQK